MKTFKQWIAENGSINQSMPELSNEERPDPKRLSAEPFSSVEDYPVTKNAEVNKKKFKRGKKS